MLAFVNMRHLLAAVLVAGVGAGWFGPTEFKKSRYLDLTLKENEKHSDAVQELSSLGTEFHISDETKVSKGTMTVIYNELEKARKDPLWWQHKDRKPHAQSGGDDDDKPAPAAKAAPVAKAGTCKSHSACGPGKFCGAADGGEPSECYACLECEADRDGITPCKKHCSH